MTDYKMDMRGDGMGEELEVDYFRFYIMAVK